MFITRGDILANHLSQLSVIGLQADLLLPSAVVWRCLLESTEERVLVANSSSNQTLEVASTIADGTLHIRTIERDCDECADSGFERGLVEYLRPLLDHSEVKGSPLTIGWIGEGSPFPSTGGRP